MIGVLGIRDIKVKNYRDTGYLGGKLKGYGIFRKEIPGYRASNLYFLKYKIGLSINIKDFSVKSWPVKTACPRKTPFFLFDSG